MAASKTLIALDVGLSKPIRGLPMSDIISRGEILRFSLDDSNEPTQPSLLLSDTPQVALPDGVVYSKKKDLLYYTNMGVPPLNDGSVYSLCPDGSDLQVVLSKGQIHTPKQLALDDTNDKLYISDREGLRVLRCNLDGSELEVLIENGDFHDAAVNRDQTRWCVGITVSPRRGLFYWTQKGPSKSNTGRIFCASIEGSGLRQRTLLLQNLPEPIDLEIDEATNTLYWTDRGELPYGNTFNRMKLEESGTRIDSGGFVPTPGFQHEIIVQNFKEAIGLCHDKDNKRWYVADMGGTIWFFDEDGGDKVSVFSDESRSFTGIVLVS
ncbi:3-hydroxybutyryl-CoA dehydrogenase [Alternaria alternata]|nr:3-hydroxybutyryl-CoA dehydrogenase [Alternaria alternata]